MDNGRFYQEQRYQGISGNGSLTMDDIAETLTVILLIKDIVH